MKNNANQIKTKKIKRPKYTKTTKKNGPTKRLQRTSTQRDYKERARQGTTKNGNAKRLQKTSSPRNYKERACKENT